MMHENMVSIMICFLKGLSSHMTKLKLFFIIVKAHAFIIVLTQNLRRFNTVNYM